nr:hypothetical protein [Tanacetum cinerariifolium]
MHPGSYEKDPQAQIVKVCCVEVLVEPSSEGEEEGERGISEDLKEEDGWTTGGGTHVVLSGSTWSVIIFGSRSTSLEEEERGGGGTEGPTKTIPLSVVIALISPLGLGTMSLGSEP